MKHLFTRIRTSTFLRFALPYLLMLAVVLLCLFCYMFFYVEAEVRDNTLESHVNRLGRISEQHEGYIASMLNSAIQMGLSPVIQPFMFDETPGQAYALLQQMAPYTVTNSFCDQMFLCFSEDDHLYSATSSMSLDMFLDMVSYEYVSAQALHDLIRSPGTLTILPSQRVESPFIDGNRRDMTTFLMPLGTSPSSSKGTMIFMLSENAYQELFSDAIENVSNTYILHQGQIIASSLDFDFPADSVLSLAQQPAPSRLAPISWNGDNWFAVSYSSPAWNLQYVTILRAEDISHSAWSSMVGVSLLFTGLGALGTMISLVLAQRNIRPIREIVSMLPGEDAAADAFSSIQTGIRELSERNTDLTTRLERSLPMQRHDFVLRFMKGRYESREAAITEAAAIGMSIDKPWYAIILHGVHERGDQHPLDLRKPPFSDLAGVSAFGVELMAIKAHLYLVFSDTPEAIRDLALRIHQAGIERFGHAVVALSETQSDFSAAPGAYLEAATAFDNRFVMDDSGLMDYASISTSIEDILPKARKLTDSIDQALSIRDRSMLSGRIDELLQFLKHTNMSAFAFRLIYNDVIDKLLRRHASVLVSGRSVQAYYDIFTLSSCQSIDDLDRLLRRLCNSIIAAPQMEAQTVAEVEAPSVISQVASYIRSHFADPEMSISAIAEAFEMPTARLSLAFKDEMRMSPLEYLTLLRVEKSKELLRATDESIKDIAANVGYYDASSFIRRFKQMTGVTPLQYRRSKEDGYDPNADS